jgi:glutathione synthase/RimK-type ligase-like ATP-grasp enzyme
MATVALVTWSGLPDLDPDDRHLVRGLAGEGITAVPAVWSAPAVRWEDFDLAVLRSTWDYHRRIEEFLRWVGTVSERTLLLNDPATVRWNSHKSYLRDLEAAGIPIVPTVWGRSVLSATGVLRAQGWERGVMKPAVSADGYETSVFTAATEPENERRFARLRGRGEVMLQPYLPAVDGPGERSLVFFDGVYSHTALRAPKLSTGSGLREGASVEPTEAERQIAERAVTTVRPVPLYGRVDLVQGPSGPCVMELELIEPTLYLGTRDGSAARLASAIRRRLDDR